jgi:uncharacterized protein YbjT (DUF2867 family)
MPPGCGHGAPGVEGNPGHSLWPREEAVRSSAPEWTIVRPSAALTEDGHAGQTYALTGPRAITVVAAWS